MNNNQDAKLLDLLHSEWRLLENSASTLLQSLQKCRAIGLKQEYSFEEQESFDSLTSKFGRTSNLFSQKIIRTIWGMLHEPFVPFIDLMNISEKIGLICSSDQMVAVRDLRNQITHEYIPEALHDLVPEVIQMTGELIGNIECCKKFLISREWL
jgi:hypothetical protein